MPPASDFDTERYRQEVLEPSRKAGNTPPPDLMTRYAVSAPMETDEAAFDARVDEVVKYWRRLQQKIVYKPLAVALIAGHARLEDAGELSYVSFARQRSAGREEALTELEARVQDIAASTPAVLRSMVAWLYSECHGLVTTGTITSKLASHQVAVMEHPWVLPARPSRLSGLAARLDTLDLRLAAETVFGTSRVRAGFRLHHGFELTSGERIATEALAKKKKEVAQRPHDDRKTAHEEVLQVLQQCADRGELDALLLWQLIEVLQPQVSEGLPNRSVVSLAVSLGFDRSEAAELVVTLTQQRSADRGPSAAALRKQVSEAEQAGDTEEAAALLAELIATHGDGDDSLRSRLRSLPPPPPARVVATDQGDAVRIEWQPGPARAGHVHYRVVRSCGSVPSPPAELTVADTDGLSATDHQPLNGVRLHYTVFAARGTDVWSTGTTAAEVLRVPEVSGFRLEAHPDAVAGSWRVAPGTTDVIVTRAEGSPPPTGEGHPVLAALTDFHDPGLQAGVRYYYRACAVYVNDTGERWVAPGIVRWATPARPLTAVGELHAELQPGANPGILLTWPTTESGTVRIYRSNGPSPVPARTSIEPGELTRFGQPLLGRIVSSADGQSQLRVQLFNGRSCFTAITVGAERAVTGASAAVAVMSPVTKPTARRNGDRVWLRWTWADDCHVCRIDWSAGPDTPSTTPVECGRQRFDDDGGFGIVVGPAPVTVSICSVYRDASGEILSVPAQVQVPGRDVLVRYAFQRRTWWAPWRRDRLLLRADRECRLPSLTVVHKAGRIMPLRAEQGEPVANVPGAQLAPGRLLSVPIPDLDRRTAGWLACFFAGDPPDGISLMPATDRR